MRLIWFGGAIIMLLLVIVMSGVIAIGAVQRRSLTPPELNLTIGALRFTAFLTHTPNCRIPSLRAGNSFCSTNSIHSTDEYYVVWMLERSRRNGVAYEEARRLMVIRLDNGGRPGVFTTADS